jgi:hypothetical protein
VFGNAGHESAGYETLQEIKPIVPGSRGGYGIMQWTGPRRRSFEAYCERNGYSPSDMMVNYKWLFVELKGDEGKVLPKLKAAKTLIEKTKVFSDVFLRPGIPHMESRFKWAERAIEAWEAEKAKQLPTVPQVPVEPVLGDLDAFLSARYPETEQEARQRAAMLADAIWYRLSNSQPASEAGFFIPQLKPTAAMPATMKGNEMDIGNVKKWWESMGVNGGLVSLVSMLLLMTGYDAPIEAVTDLGNKVVELVGLAGAILSIYGRIRATRKVG